MAYFRICPDCGARLDPGEACDCKEKPPPGVQDRKAEEENPLNQIYHKKGDMSNGIRVFSCVCGGGR